MKKLLVIFLLGILLTSCENKEITTKQVTIVANSGTVLNLTNSGLVKDKKIENTGGSVEKVKTNYLDELFDERDKIKFIKKVKEKLFEIGEIKNDTDISFTQSGIILNGKFYNSLNTFKENLFKLQEKYYYHYNIYNDGDLDIDFSKIGYFIEDKKISFGDFGDTTPYAMEIFSGISTGFPSCKFTKREGNLESIIQDEIIFSEYIISKNKIVGFIGHTTNSISFGGSDNNPDYLYLLINNNIYDFSCLAFDLNLIKIKSNKLKSSNLKRIYSNPDEFYDNKLYINHYFTFIFNGAKNNSKELLEIAYNLKYKPSQTLEQFIETYKEVKDIKIESIDDLGENKYKTLVSIDGVKYETVFEIVEEYKLKTISTKVVK